MKLAVRPDSAVIAPTAQLIRQERIWTAKGRPEPLSGESEFQGRSGQIAVATLINTEISARAEVRVLN
ncbi:MAG: hypothetical protein OEY27_03740 [Gammaproteobacteria bacterium]|nr:hypothetical protein [Gammaproteobacteria bacterium]